MSSPPQGPAEEGRSVSSGGGATPESPPEPSRGKRRHRRAVDPGRGPEPVWHDAAWEDDPRAWGEDAGALEDDSDRRILREKPPHW